MFTPSLLFVLFLQIPFSFGVHPNRVKSSQLAVPQNPAHSSATHSGSSIRALFTLTAGQLLSYPTPDLKGPKPREVWVQAYNRAKAAGLIPSIPKTTLVNGGATYPPSFTGEPCNPGISHCNRTDDIRTGPAGTIGISFDDGPQPPSEGLLNFLQASHQPATHFLIGSRIMTNLKTFEMLEKLNSHYAVHTYSHPMMTSLTDQEVLGELGWTMQLIHDKTKQKIVCRHWRPPYGDVDDRIRAIARHVFGLETILWGYDTRDWCLSDLTPNKSACGVGNGPQTIEELQGTLDFFLESPKREGLIILQHEQSTRAVLAFEQMFPKLRKLGWIPKAIPDLFHQPWYQA